MPLEEIQKQIDVNLYGAIRLVQATSDLLIASKGLIINISSLNGHAPGEFIGPYNMGKFAIEAFSESLRHEIEKFGIKVVVVNPGQYSTRDLLDSDASIGRAQPAGRSD